MRVTTAFNRVLGIEGTTVTSVEFTSEGLVLGVRATARRHLCPCGARVWGRYDQSRRRWRHLDIGVVKVWLEADLARIQCPRCAAVRTEQVPWARPGARHTRDFHQVAGWLAQRMDKSAVAQLMRCSWATVDRIVAMVVADHVDDARFDGLTRIGVDEISYRRGRKFLTLVVDHDRPRVVWVGLGHSKATMDAFFEEVGPQRTQGITAASMDASPAYRASVAEHAENAVICLDPFHVMRMVTDALDSVFRSRSRQLPVLTDAQGRPTNKYWQRTRTALRLGAEKLSAAQRGLLAVLRQDHTDVFAAWKLKEDFRELYASTPPDQARSYLRRWIRRAARSRLRPFVNLAHRFTALFDHIAAAVEHDLSNSRVEGTNAKIRLIQRRGYGHHGPESLAAMIYLCCSGIVLTLPTRR